ncbi:hypothetical protein FEF65_10010 [Mariprofundus erugo]|uniref:Uncharacterized protein n=1 Tax=Mariprofundus erugo TaxID=2528639 RepID=A0A5R9GPZ9_9PROT|nr:hypothetical protein [Mariprofundus erugo]TLS66493.1 hypothetical protein FEF65_10010 [Mariprofundus erugo]
MSIILKIPDMDDNKLLVLFHNALRKKEQGDSRAESVLDAVQSEWKLRLEQAKLGKYKATMPEEGMLKTFGYCVGSSGVVDSAVRQKLLVVIFKSDLPVVGSPAYTLEWGEKLSKERMNKMRKTLIGFIANNRYPTQALAREHWKEDLEFIEKALPPLLQ